MIYYIHKVKIERDFITNTTKIGYKSYKTAYNIAKKMAKNYIYVEIGKLKGPEKWPEKVPMICFYENEEIGLFDNSLKEVK